MKIHKSITLDKVMAAAESSMFGMENPGFCIYCGQEADGCEPDARKDHCDNCERNGVYGAEELLLHMVA